MLRFLFPRLTAAPERGARAFAAVTAMAREPGYYRRGGVADTLDGRFALLATITALALVRIERDGEAGEALSVALTERFIESMEAEHRELGLSDPGLGKTVRKLVGALARRVDDWRKAVAGQADWTATTRSSVLQAEPDPAALEYTSAALQRDWKRLLATPLGEFQQGNIA